MYLYQHPDDMAASVHGGDVGHRKDDCFVLLCSCCKIIQHTHTHQAIETKQNYY